MFLIDLTIIIDPVEFIFSYKHAILKVDGVTRASESCSYLKAVKHTRYMHRFASLDSKSIRQAKQIYASFILRSNYVRIKSFRKYV